MDKINFVNNGLPAINDTNLNQLQTNVETAINQVQTNVENANELINKSNVLWQGIILMKDGQSVTLSENISAQKSGIVLVWSVWNGSSAEDWGWQFNFVPKKFVELMPGRGSDFTIMGDEFNKCAVKFLYINNNKVTGHTSNSNTGTKNGITYNNNNYVLRYVIGV